MVLVYVTDRDERLIEIVAFLSCGYVKCDLRHRSVTAFYGQQNRSRTKDAFLRPRRDALPNTGKHLRFEIALTELDKLDSDSKHRTIRFQIYTKT